ncbi:MAG: flagellar basal body-associated FliL family protein [Pseudomonadota bacterium]|nr:flagellar basal body-associated FliL family protein [Pseudomonadota bacterium]
MASADDIEDGEAGEGAAPKRKRKLSGKVLILFIVLPLVVLLGGGGAAFMMLGGGGGDHAAASTDGHGAGGDSSGHGDEGESSHGDSADSGSHGSGGGGHGGGGGETGQATFAGNDLIFYDLPDMIVNLNTDGKQPRYLKIRVALEFGDRAMVGRVEKVLPRIVDHFQVYLRELRREDLQGSAGVYRLKEELMIRVNQAVRPGKVRDVLFKEMLIQ